MYISSMHLFISFADTSATSMFYEIAGKWDEDSRDESLEIENRYCHLAYQKALFSCIKSKHEEIDA